MTEFNPGDRVRYQHKHLAVDKYNGQTATVREERDHWNNYIAILFEDGVDGLALPEELTLLPGQG